MRSDRFSSDATLNFQTWPSSDAVEIPGPLHLILLTFPPINYSAQPDVGKEPGS